MRTPTEARRDGESTLARKGFVRGIGREAATWTNNETGEVGRMVYIPDASGSIVEIKFQGPPVDGVLPTPHALVRYSD